MVVLGLDYGVKRIGVAKSDELNMFAHALECIERENDEQVIERIKELTAQYNPKKIVIGLPKNLKGEESHAAAVVKEFAEKMKKSIAVDTELWDERMTSKEASRYLRHADMAGSKKKKKIDQLAAQIMLQGYLDTKYGVM